MKKKIIVLSASPKKDGNTAKLVQWFKEGALTKGADIEIVDVAQLKYKTNGCIACMGCQGKKEFGGCVIDDEASPVLRRLPQMDVIVLATPVYFFGPSAQLKLILDRFYSLCKFDRQKGTVETVLRGKTIVIIASSGAPSLDTGLAMIRQTFQAVAGFSGARCEVFLVPGAGLSGALAGNKDARDKAIAFGQLLG